MNLGTNAISVLADYWRNSKPGQHVLVNGDTGSGKSTLASQLVRPRLRGGSHVMMLVMKPTDDATISKEFKGWTRWKKYQKPGPLDRRVLLWPDTRKMNPAETLAHQKNVFTEALEQIYMHPGWVVCSDESLYLCHPSYLGLGEMWALHNFQGRSMGNTLMTLTQRPSHLPVIVYSSCTHAFVGRTSETADVKRLSELSGKLSGKEIAGLLRDLGNNDFLYIRKGSDELPRVVNLRR